MRLGGQHLTPAAFAREGYPVPIVREDEWAPGPVWTGSENIVSHRDTIPGP